MINTFPICSISFDMLENLLLSSPVCCDNPQKIVEICSKWVMHDVKNRYHLIPQIAVDINHNRMVEYDDYKIEELADLHNLTEQYIRVKLWNTLSSTSLVPPATNNISRKGRGSFSKILPVFVASTGDMTVRILNVDLNEIASFSFFSIISTNEPKDIELRNTYFKVSATSIRDNLFVMFTPDYYSRLFYVYNSTSKELRSLNCFRKKVASILCKYSLLNCRDQVYCCFDNGQVFKYLVEMNRWMIFSKTPASVGGNGKRVCFTSHGNELYRMYKNAETVETRSTYVIEEFNFQQNVWLSLPHSSFTPATQSSYDTPISLISINAGDILAVIFPSYLRLFDLSTRSWREISLAGDVGPTSSNRKPVFALVQCQGELLRVFCDKLYYWSGRNGRWVLKKELPEKSHSPDGVLDRPTSFKHITAVHGWGHHQKRINL